MKHFLRSILCSVICFALLFNVTAFAGTDQNPVEYLNEKGIMIGDENGDLHENDFITRAELCKILVKAFDLKKTAESKAFKDVSSHWAKEYIDILSSEEYIKGVSDSEFDPDGDVTYEQALTIVSRMSGYEANSYPYDYVSYALDNGISDKIACIIGEKINRYEVAQMLVNVISSNEFKASEEEQYLSAIKDAQSENEGSYALPSYGVSAGGAVSGAGGGGGVSGTGSGYSSVPNEYYNTEEYSYNPENIFKSAISSPLSTFALDVDTASYSNLRRKLINGDLPEKGVVRTEEMVNYFKYDFPKSNGTTPISVNTEVSKCSWNENNYLAMIAVSGDELSSQDAPPSNLVFLIDVSGSMNSYNKLPLVQKSLLFLTENLRKQDKITIVTYAGRSDVVLDTVSGSEKEKINKAILSLRAGGSTNGAEGIETAYEKAQKAFIKGGNNRVILCTDGDFNVGISSEASLEDLISKKRESGVFLSVLGYGMWNYKDNKMETLADSGNGNYAYIDTLKEAKKVLYDDMMSTLYTVAKDVKIQVEFNPAKVSQYRLIGYENRALENEEFTDDTKDAGELGSGQTMVALYEIVPQNNEEVSDGELKYQNISLNESDDLLTVHLRYKLPDSNTSEQVEDTVVKNVSDTASSDLNFASSIAEFAMLLNDSEYKANADFDHVQELALNNRGDDPFGYRAEFIQLVDMAKWLSK